MRSKKWEVKEVIKKWINIIKCGFKRSDEENDINIQQSEELIKDGATLIDVRSPQEYEEGHLDGAICIPTYEIENVIQNKIPNKEEKIILYCDSGIRSKKAQRKLEKMGYVNVYNLYR